MNVSGEENLTQNSLTYSRLDTSRTLWYCFRSLFSGTLCFVQHMVLHQDNPAAMPAVSVVLTTYNGERYLREAIDSIVNQTFRDFEFIIVDDASTDSTPTILRHYQEKDPRITVLRNEANRGGTASLNVGLAHARGAYVAVMDHDDVSLPGRLRAQVDFLQNHPDIFLVGTRAHIIDERGVRISTSKSPTDPDAIARMLPKRNPFYHPSVMFRNDSSVRYREKIRYVMDYDLYLRLVLAGKRLANLPDVYLCYRLTSTSATLQKREQQELFAQAVQRLYDERLRTGQDSYEQFDPHTVLSVDPDASTDKLVIREHAAGLFRANNFSEARRYCRKYFRLHGWDARVALQYCASFLGKRFMTLKRRFIARV